MPTRALFLALVMPSCSVYQFGGINRLIINFGTFIYLRIFFLFLSGTYIASMVINRHLTGVWPYSLMNKIDTVNK